MKSSTSKIIMAAILITVVILAIILGLLIVFLVEFFCSFLLHRRQRSKMPINFEIASTTQSSPQYCQRSKGVTNFTTTSITQPPPPPPPESQQEHSSIAPITTLNSFYAQLGVLHAPRNYLFPKISTKDHHNFDALEIVQNNMPYPKLVHEVQSLQCSNSSTSTMEEQFVYISNPIFDNEKIGLDHTPFETPNSSPSCLEIIIASSSEDEEGNCGISSSSSTPSSVLLTPMKKLPAKACSISLRDTTSLGTSRSDSNSNNSSLSGSPCTSPSW
ncbi:uncharacterized protein LOC129871222 [Solanum dulcamara]|uniref:uncharacterized protein LOC129871222 n=1 Tax=Solanum dulcamara TaxID=45834 RepID=UPI0024864200|nr:uncharacterized protein LOC129871222 [Solanum dulcamara]